MEPLAIVTTTTTTTSHLSSSFLSSFLQITIRLFLSLLLFCVSFALCHRLNKIQSTSSPNYISLTLCVHSAAEILEREINQSQTNTMMSTHMSNNIRHQNWSYQKRWCYNHLLTTDKFTVKELRRVQRMGVGILCTGNDVRNFTIYKLLIKWNEMSLCFISKAKKHIIKATLLITCWKITEGPALLISHRKTPAPAEDVPSLSQAGVQISVI